MKLKYGNIKVKVDGIQFDSKLEAARYGDLRVLELRGEISNLECQPEFMLQEKFKRNGKIISAIKYKADFRYISAGAVIVEDVKGVRTPTYQLKKKLFLQRNPEIIFVEIYKDKEVRF